MAETYTIGNLISKFLKDKDLKEKFKKNPKEVLKKEFQIDLPENLEIKVIEDTPTTKYIVIPCWEGTEALSNLELKSIAGGSRQSGEVNAPESPAAVQRGWQDGGHLKKSESD